MSVRAFYRYINVTVEPDREPDAEPETYAAECAVCHARSPHTEQPEAARDWIPDHFRYNPSHHTYHAITLQPVRAWIRP